MRVRGHQLAALAVLTALTGSTASCTQTTAPAPTPSLSASPDRPRSADTPEAAAQAFADALAAGDPAPVPFAGDGGAATATMLLKGLGELRPRVRVISASQTSQTSQTNQTGPASDTDATAQLRYEWPVTDASGTGWTYDTALRLTRADDGWRVALTPEAVAPNLLNGERLVSVARPGPRGRILGAGGAVLVTDRPVRRFGIDKARLTPEQATAAGMRTAAAALATAVGVDPTTYAGQVAAAGPRAFVEAVVLRENDPLLTSALRAIGTIPGSTAVTDTLPLAPSRTFARPLLGTVGPATAEIVQASNGAIKAGDVVGLSGLQKTRQAQLAGSPGWRINALAPSGATRVLFDGRGRPGQDLRTTLSLPHQGLAEALLSRITGPASAIVAIRPSTGDILAAASGPGGQGNSTATLGLYPPGSTFKVVTALGMLRAGLSPTSPVPCTTAITVDGRAFGNYDAYPAARLGTVPLSVAFAASCNTAMISQRDVIGRQRLVDAAASLGLTAEPDLGLPAVLGRVPDASGLVEQAAAVIGQGRVQASPLGMATVAASVAAGRTVHPRLVISPPPPAAESSTTAPPTPVSPVSPVSPVTAQEATQLRALMRAVVTSGTGAQLADLPGGVLAKTGTAEYGDANPPLTHAWMIGVRGDEAVAVFVETGAGGARTAGPILKAFLSGT